MSAAARVAGKVHKWLALLMAIQILFWFVSGLFFAIAPIDQVRSEHVKADSAAPPVSAQAAAAGLQKLGNQPPGEKIEIRSLMGAPVALKSPHEGRPRLYDLQSGRIISPISASQARAIAEADYSGDLRAARVTLVTEESTEYRAALPAWRVDFDDDASRALYVAQDTGAVTARRSTLWRVFDFLWSLHIMDYGDRDDFRHPLIVVFAIFANLTVLSGIVLWATRVVRALRRSRPGTR